jgi:protein tyrosine/serine phosphatase
MPAGTRTADPIDLSTPAGRRRARNELHWGDHGFLRLRFRNLHRISPEMYRANQPSPEHIGRYARELGLKTIINLRGTSPKGYYLLEKEACDRNGVKLVDYQVFSRDAPSRESVLGARDLSGLMAVLYMHFRQGQPIEQAKQQLSFKYLHIREGKTGMLDYFFETYLRDGKPKGLTFADWVARDYDREAVKAAFLHTWKQKLNLDQLLRRE